jgi:hypothetical protein
MLRVSGNCNPLCFKELRVADSFFNIFMAKFQPERNNILSIEVQMGRDESDAVSM